MSECTSPSGEIINESFREPVNPTSKSKETLVDIYMPEYECQLSQAERNRMLAAMPEPDVDIDNPQKDSESYYPCDVDFACDDCGTPIEDGDTYYRTFVGSGYGVCESCVEKYREDFRPRAAQFAEKFCEVGDLPDYDPSRTPQQYFSSCRHNHSSNYDDLRWLVKGMSGGDELYDAIKQRTNALVVERIRAKFDAQEADFILSHRELTIPQFIEKVGVGWQGRTLQELMSDESGHALLKECKGNGP